MGYGTVMGSTRLAAFLAMLLLRAVLHSPAEGTAGSAPVFRTVTCPDDIQTTRCGYVQVPRNHAQAAGPQIELFVAVQQPAQAGRRDPLFYLAGGLGEASAPLVGDLGQVYPTRTVVGVDQRGVGRSRPSLDCPQVNALVTRIGKADLQSAQAAPLFLKALNTCGAALRGRGIKLEDFDTTQAALDIETVRRALGYSQINLYGGSYGTRLAQEVLRRAPEHLRAVVLDGVTPPSVDRVAESPRAMQDALMRVLTACADNNTCHARYPNLSRTYRAVLQQLDARPLLLTYAGVKRPFDGLQFKTMLSSGLLVVPALEAIPLLIQDAQRRDVAAIEALLGGGEVSDNMNEGAFYSNECRGEVAYSTPAKLRAGLAAAPEFADVFSVRVSISSPDIFAACRSLGLTQPAPDENAPVVSSVPTLLLAGEFDPATPPAWLPQAAAGLSRSVSVTLWGASHVPGLTTPCGARIAAQFLDQPEVAPDTGCARAGMLNFR